MKELLKSYFSRAETYKKRTVMDTKHTCISSFEDKFADSRDMFGNLDFNFREITAEEVADTRVKGYEYIID